MRKLILLIIIPACLTAWFIVSFQHKLSKGMLPQINPRFSGEVFVLNENNLSPKGVKSLHQLSLSNNGSRLLFVADTENKTKKLMLWEAGSNYLSLTSNELDVVGSPMISGDGLKAVFFAQSVGEKSKASSLYLWEDGFGVKKIIANAFAGPWSLTLSFSGNRIVVSPIEENSQLEIDQAQLLTTTNNPGQQKESSQSLVIDFYSRIDKAPYSNIGEVSAAEEYSIQLINNFGTSKLLKLDGSKLTLLDIDSSAQAPIVELKSVGLKRKKNISDVDGDGADDFLLFSKVGEVPAWRAYTTGGGDGPVQRVTKSGPKVVTWRVGDIRGVPVIGDYNGDGVLDLATFTPMAQTAFVAERVNWKIFLSQPAKLTSNFIIRPTGGYLTFNWGDGASVPVPADYDGDGKTDLGVYYPSEGKWRLMFSGWGFENTKAEHNMKGYGIMITWGGPEDIPLTGDFNGDGKDDLALWQEAKEEGKSSILQINILNLDQNKSQETSIIEFGKKGDIPVTGDFDCDHKTDIAVYRKNKKLWLVKTGEKIEKIAWNDQIEVEPLAADFDGDGCDDLATYSTEGYFRWTVMPSSFKKEGNQYLPLNPKYRWGDSLGFPPMVQLRNYYYKVRNLLKRKD